MKRIKHLLVLGIIAMTGLLSACSAPEKPLRVALLEWPPYELAFWAREQGWIKPELARLLEYKTPAEVTRAFASGAVDIIAVTTDFALTLSDQFPEARIFIVIDASNGGDVVLSKAPVAGKQDLVGKTLAVEAGPLGTYMLTRFRDHYQLDKDDLKVEYVDLPAQVENWRDTDVDLTITYEPYRSRMLALGATEIFTSRQIPNEIVDVFLVRENLIKEREKDLKAFANAWFRAVDDLKQGKEELFTFIGERESMSADDIKYVLNNDISVPDYKQNLQLLKGEDQSFFNGLKRNESIMLKEGMITSNINHKALVTAELIE